MNMARLRRKILEMLKTTQARQLDYTTAERI